MLAEGFPGDRWLARHSISARFEGQWSRPRGRLAPLRRQRASGARIVARVAARHPGLDPASSAWTPASKMKTCVTHVDSQGGASLVFWRAVTEMKRLDDPRHRLPGSIASSRRSIRCAGYRLRRRARGPVRRPDGGGRGGAAGDGLRADRRDPAAVRPVHGDRHDRRRRAVRLVEAAHQRPDQRHLDRGPERISVVPGVDEKIQAAVLLAFLVGVDPARHHLLRLGDLTRYISHSVIVGFTLGAAALLVLDQMKNLLGLTAMGDVHDHFLYRFWLTMTAGGDVNTATLAVGLGTIAMVLALRWLKSRLGLRLLPELLLAVLTMAAVVAWLGLEAAGRAGRRRDSGQAAVVRALPRSTTSRFASSRRQRLAIAVLGLLEAIAMAKAIAAQTRQKLDMNQQCLSEGLANLTGSFFQCFPGSGSLTRSAINQQAGAATQWSGVSRRRPSR